ncbi:Protein of unknown function [Amphritea atlantica]|uniref:DUF3530 domain-containing protein n=2 Tax=Amphritea atlantica TaxID=355243 RepID=A0A1H9M9B4_9GAMM|nr:Protein of unknown function [Amphritea atlantica]
MYFAHIETQPTFALANPVMLFNNPTMKPNKALIFALFLSSSATLHGAQGNDANKSSSQNSAAENTETAAANNQTDATVRIMPDLWQQQQQDLAQAQSPETEVIWLEAGERKQLALLLRAASSSPAGSVLIFPDRATSADWPAIVHPLRTQLTEYGWNTLSITLPDLPEEQIPPRTLPTLQDIRKVQTPTDETVSNTTPQPADPTAVNSQQASDATTSVPDNASAEKSLLAYQKTVTELGQQASSQLAEVEGDVRIILGVGEGADWAMYYFLQDETQANRFLVLLDPAQVDDKNAPNLLQMISDAKAPILDLWFDRNSVQQQQASLRKRAARRSGNKGYRQIRLNQRSADPRREPLWLTQQLRGILKTHILDTRKPEPPKAEAMELTPGSGQLN